MYIHSHIFFDGVLNNFGVLILSKNKVNSDSVLFVDSLYLFIYFLFEEVYVIIQLDKFYKYLFHVEM